MAAQDRSRGWIEGEETFTLAGGEPRTGCFSEWLEIGLPGEDTRPDEVKVTLVVELAGAIRDLRVRAVSQLSFAGEELPREPIAFGEEVTTGDALVPGAVSVAGAARVRFGIEVTSEQGGAVDARVRLQLPRGLVHRSTLTLASPPEGVWTPLTGWMPVSEFLAASATPTATPSGPWLTFELRVKARP